MVWGVCVTWCVCLVYLILVGWGGGVCVYVIGGVMWCRVEIIGVGVSFGLCVGEFAYVCLCCASVVQSSGNFICSE